MRLSAYIGGVSITMHIFLPEDWRKTPPAGGDKLFV